MADRDSTSKTKAPSWGSPASSSVHQKLQLQDGCVDSDEFFHGNSSSSSRRYQRPGPYHNNSNRGRHFNGGSPYQSSGNQDDSPVFHSQGQNFSPGNPYLNKEQRFSSNNPFQSKGQNLSPGYPFQSKNRFSSPDHTTLSRPPNFQSSPITRTPGSGGAGYGRSRTSDDTFYSLSPNRPGSHQHHRGNFDSSQRFNQRNRSINNPGGSNNIRDYIHPSMLDDPWKDLPPTPVVQSY